MTRAQSDLINDTVVRCSPFTQQKIANVIKEYISKIDDVKQELEQERVISASLESVIKDYEKLIIRIQEIIKSDEVNRIIDDFNSEHSG